MKRPGLAQTRRGCGAWVRTGSNRAREEAKWQARSFDPGMVSVKAEIVPGERKAVTSIRPRMGVRCGESESVEPLTGENG